MTKKRFTPVESLNVTPVTDNVQKRKSVSQTDGTSPQSNFKTLFIISCVAIVVLGYFAFFGRGSGGSSKTTTANSDVQAVLGRAYVELGQVSENVTDPDDSSNKVTFWRFSDIRGTWGYCTMLTMPNPYPNLLLMTDATLKITKIKNMSDFPMAGADRRAEYLDAMSRYDNRTLLDFQHIEKSTDEGEVRTFREIMRDSIAKALKVMCIDQNGIDWFRQNFPQGIKFSKVGTKLEPWRVTCEDGREINSSMLAGRKYAFLSASACGSCRATVTEISQDMLTKGGMGKDQLIFIFTGKPEEKSKMKDMLSGEYLVLDQDQANFCKMISFTEGSPSIMLIDSSGTVFAKEDATSLNDVEGRAKTLKNFYESR